MSIPGNSGFQEPPKKVSASDIINFQLGTDALQTSFTKALQEPDPESVVIVNIHQPIQSTQVEMSNTRVMKNSREKRTSLNDQIRDIIQKSIKESKHYKNERTDDSTEDKEEGMFVVDHNRGATKQMKDQDDKIREDTAREVRKFDQTMRSSSYRSSLDTDFIREPEQKLQKNRESFGRELPSQETLEVSDKEESLQSTYDTELIDNEVIQDDVEKELESRETLSNAESSIHTHEQQMQPTHNMIAPLPSVTTIASSSSISPHCIMSLPPDFFELFEKLVGVMIIEQNTSGITDVTVTINRPGSILDKSEVLLQFFDTNPRSCNVELRGSPEAVHYFQKYHGEFVAAFRESKLSLDVNIRGPSLLLNKKIVKRKK